MSSLADVFAPDGLLAAHLTDFSFREPQARMAALVERALVDGDHAVLEAGTGIGKTYAYVVPILASGASAIISTGTRTLQDQLFARDLPALGAALGRPVDIAVLKGRANYLCLQRLETARLDATLGGSLAKAINAIAGWAKETDSGDLTGIGDLEQDFRLRARVTSTADNCVGTQCPFFDDCFVVKARRRAQAAQVVIVNHHLLLADLALKEAGFGELLPGADAVVVDEAHLLPDIAQQFFGVSVSSRQLVRLGHDIADEARVAGAGQALESDGLMLARETVRWVASAARDQGRRPGLPDRFAGDFDALATTLAGLAADLEAFPDAAPLKRCRERCLEIAARLQQITGAGTDAGLKWFEASEQAFAAHFTPFDVGEALAARIDAQGGSFVFTSASLAVGDDFGHFNARIGLTPAIEAVLPSPFDYAAQAGLYLPDGLPAPGEPEFTDALLAACYPLIEAAGGGAFLLFTSHRALAAADAWFARRPPPGPLFVQGADSRSRLLDEFRASGNGILLGTGSFWQGVDVRGSALRVVVIDKLPFAVPDDPLVRARIDAIRRDGGDPFRSFQLPEAVLALKQGVGRLIRDYADRGLIVLGDPRLKTRSYGKVFLQSLPPFKRLDDAADAERFAARLNDTPASLTA